MSEEFMQLRMLLDQDTLTLDLSCFSIPVHRRLIRALVTDDDAAGLANSDLVALVAHVLRREEAHSAGQAVWLRVPAGQAAINGKARTWPDATAWRMAGLGVRDEHGRYKLSPRRWYPSWLPEQRGSDLTDALYAEQSRRTYAEVSGDPFLRAIGRSRYRCDAQREAVRAVLSVDDGSTVVVNLPTGSGKSLCAHLPALLRSEQGGVSVVVVPTTALALDQDRAVRQWVGHDTAYVGGSTSIEVERRRGIRKRVRDGSQRLVFTSPEGLLQSLRPALYEAARRGLLRFLVVDEAHMVEQWGDEFRSAFQEVSGLRTDLQRQIPAGSRLFTTILLTATLSESALDTLETLFGEPGPLTLVSAAQLRPEPSYWVVRAGDRSEQESIVLEALQHLPRPLLLYLTEPEDALAWLDRLRAVGHRRVDIVTGKTPNEDRARVIRRWRDGDTDIVVATSAFGLGVDQGEVRAVVHATLPENIDRFYQEVGRGGRDGLASTSLVVYTAEDIRRAEAMNRRKIIGIERGQERWTRMFEQRLDLGGGRIRLPIDVQPSLRPGDINMDNDLNRAWNVRTLTLMSRARLLVLDAEPPPSRSSVDPDGQALSPDDYDRALLEHQRHRVISLRHHGTTTTKVWQADVEPVRARTNRADRRSHELMLELLDQTRCISEIFADAYAIPAREGSIRRQRVEVARACGGCAHCRAHGRVPWAEPLPIGFPRWPVSGQVGEVLNGLRSNARGIAVFYSDINGHRLGRLVQWVIGQGVRVVVMPAASLVEFGERLHQAAAAGQWVFTYALEEFRFLEAPPLPSLVYLPEGFSLPMRLRPAFEGDHEDSSVRVLLAPSNLLDPDKPGNTLRTMVGCPTYDFEELSLRIGL